MKHNSPRLLILILFTFLAACAPLRAGEIPYPAEVDMGMPVPSLDAGPGSAVPETIVTDLTTHTDETYAYTFDHPSSWMLDSVVFGSRAPGGYQLTSWVHEPGMISEVPAHETLMNILIQLWDPKADLAAFVEQRKIAWEASGIEIVSEEDLTLANGQPAKEFVVKSQEGATGYFLFSTLGENYLVASGSGDIELIRQVARSLREGKRDSHTCGCLSYFARINF